MDNVKNWTFHTTTAHDGLPAGKTGRGYLLDRPSCLPDDPICQRTEVNFVKHWGKPLRRDFQHPGDLSHRCSMHFVSSFEGLDNRISSVARLIEKIHGAETGQFCSVVRPKDKTHRAERSHIGSVARLKNKIHTAELGQIGSGQAKRQNVKS